MTWVERVLSSPQGRSLSAQARPSAADPGIAPNNNGLPGSEVLRELVGALLTWGLVACVAGLVVSVIVWAVGHQQGNYGHASGGKTGVLVAAGGALLIGGANAIVAFFSGLGGLICDRRSTRHSACRSARPAVRHGGVGRWLVGRSPAPVPTTCSAGSAGVRRAPRSRWPRPRWPRWTPAPDRPGRGLVPRERRRHRRDRPPGRRRACSSRR